MKTTETTTIISFIKAAMKTYNHSNDPAEVMTTRDIVNFFIEAKEGVYQNQRYFLQSCLGKMTVTLEQLQGFRKIQGGVA